MEKQIEGSNQKVMVIIDESEYSYHALMWVLDNLKGFITDSPLVMFAALPTPNCNFAYGAQLGTTALYSLGLMCSMQEKSKKILLGILEKAVDICDSRGVKAETITEAGEPYELISSAVQKHKINLLVIGDTLVNGTLKRDFLGSQSNCCLLKANCSVLVVKKPE
ncbi:PREDICTED: uncharacterized protein LOC105113305 isoform X2 [Populus euphratica]|uniref:Uncharacterized protein LOC105113305 isoform X2 n=1 Tax=Populus euphratica TaxID=75702 RepID=A0AAJ6TBL9_POPEU|nr:PREDICTED: uncharacterized protein LOC105113305 isoform X2 [Populus euphratica]